MRLRVLLLVKGQNVTKHTRQDCDPKGPAVCGSLHPLLVAAGYLVAGRFLGQTGIPPCTARRWVGCPGLPASCYDLAAARCVCRQKEAPPRTCEGAGCPRVGASGSCSCCACCGVAATCCGCSCARGRPACRAGSCCGCSGAPGCGCGPACPCPGGHSLQGGSRQQAADRATRAAASGWVCVCVCEHTWNKVCY